MPNEFVARNGLIALADTSISGSLTVSGSVTANQGFTGSLSGTASFAISSSYALTASYALAGPGGGGGGLSVNISQINNQTVNPPSGNGDKYIYSSTGVNTFILPLANGNKNQYTIKLLEGSATIYVSDYSLIDDSSLLIIDTPNSSVDISSNNTQYLIY